MSTQVFVNLPTTDLDRSKKFFEALGWSINPHFTDENAACIVIDDNIFLMVLMRDFFATFTDKPIADPTSSCQVEVALSRDSRDAVDEITEKAIAAGGRQPKETQDLGFIYARGFEDPDGNLFSTLWMDPTAAEQGPDAYVGDPAQA